MTGTLSFKVEGKMMLVARNSIFDTVFSKKAVTADFDYDKEFMLRDATSSYGGWRTITMFSQAVKDYGLESASIRIHHNRNDPDVYFGFVAAKANERSIWSMFKTLELEVSFKAYRDKPQEFQKWSFIKRVSCTMEPEPEDAYDDNDEEHSQATDYGHSFCVTEKLCRVDVLKDYILLTDLTPFSDDWGSPIYRMYEHSLEIQLVLKFTTIQPTVVQVADPVVQIPKRNGMSFMMKILVEGLHSDFKIRVNGITFRCHKNILAGHSEIFAAMFKAEMAEVHSHELEVDDMTPEGVEAFLRYLYCQDVEAVISNGNIGFELLRAGNRYQIQDLESECKEILYSTAAKKFDIKTVLELFEFCEDVKGLEELQNKAARIFKEKSEEHEKHSEFLKMLSSANPETVAKLIKMMPSF